MMRPVRSGGRAGVRAGVRVGVPVGIRVGASIAVGAIALAVLTGCTQPVPIDPGPDATNPLCAEVVVRLPDAIGDAEKRETNAQGTGAWGTPAEALLVCGVEMSEVSSLECREFDGVEWLIDPSDENLVTATTYGRDPAISVIIDRDIIGPGQILAELSSAVSVIPVTKTCS